MSARGDDFTRRKLLWLEQVAGDLEVPDGAFRLAFIIASKFLNRKTRDAYPSQTTLAVMLGKTSRGVRDLIEQLANRGHLEVTEARGRGLTNRYRPKLKSAPPPEREAEQNELFPEVDGGAGTKPAEARGQFDSDFEEFWLQYPRKVDKSAAQRAYAKSRQSGTAADVILAGVLRYAGERDGQDHKYTKHAATWLNHQCWNDEPLPGRGERDQAHQAGASQPSHLEIALGGLNRG